jgi:phosphonate transport system substrate-binding protein
MIRRTLLLAVFALTACAGGEDKPPPPKTELVFSILSAESQSSAEKDWTPFLDDMAKSIGMKVKPFYASNYTALIEAMRFKQTDVGWFTNQSGLEAVRRANGEVFARSVNPSGVDGYEAVIVVKKGSGITLERLLKCDKTIDFGMGDAKSTSGTLAPMTYLFGPRKITPETCLATVRSANHEANLFAVASGTMDAATNNTASMERLALLGTPIAARTMANVEIIWRSPRIPEDPLVWRNDLDPILKQRISDFLFTYGVGGTPEAERQRAILERIQTKPFVRADNTHLIPVREMEATQQLIQARNKGDKAAEAKAQAALDQVAREKGTLPAIGAAGSAP